MVSAAPLFEHCLHLGHDHGNGLLDKGRRGGVRIEDAANAGLHVLEAVEDERLFGREVVVDRLLCHSARSGHVDDPDCIEAVFEEHSGGRVRDQLSGQLLLSFP